MSIDGLLCAPVRELPPPLVLAPPQPPRNPRSGSLSGAIRAWVLGLPARTVFWTRDVPASLRRCTPRVLHDMVKEYPTVRRLCKGFYWRGDDSPNAALFDRFPRSGLGPIAYAGMGSGFGALTALNIVGWTTQRPPITAISAVARVPEAAFAATTIASSPNAARRSLTWAEVTLLEALLYSEGCEPSAEHQMYPTPEGRWMSWTEGGWSAALDALRSGETLLRLGRGAVLRGPALVAAAAREARRPDWLGARVAEVAAIIGDRAAHTDRRRPVRYAAAAPHGDPFAAP